MTRKMTVVSARCARNALLMNNLQSWRPRGTRTTLTRLLRPKQEKSVLTFAYEFS